MRLWHRMQTRLVATGLAALGAGLLAAAAVTALSRLIGPIGALGLGGALLVALAALLMRNAQEPEAARADPIPTPPEPRPAEHLGFVVGFVAVRLLLRRLAAAETR